MVHVAFYRRTLCPNISLPVKGQRVSRVVNLRLRVNEQATSVTERRLYTIVDSRSSLLAITMDFLDYIPFSSYNYTLCTALVTALERSDWQRYLFVYGYHEEGIVLAYIKSQMSTRHLEEPPYTLRNLQRIVCEDFLRELSQLPARNVSPVVELVMWELEHRLYAFSRRPQPRGTPPRL